VKKQLTSDTTTTTTTTQTAQKTRFKRVPKTKKTKWICRRCSCELRFDGDPHAAPGERTCSFETYHPSMCKEVEE